MGKDRTGKYHPPKGKPSGAGKEEGLGLHPTDPENLRQYLDLTDKYTTDSDELAPSVPIRHPNRNTSKGEPVKERPRQGNQSDKTVNDTFKEDSLTINPEELEASFSKETFAELGNIEGSPAVSIYIPTHRSGVEVNEQYDPIAFKNALQTAEKKLKEKGFETSKIKTVLGPAYQLLRTETFWKNLTPGLAIFISPEIFRFIKLPVTPKETVFVNTSFYLSPLVPAMYATEYFYLLVISKKQAKLFKADAFGIQYIDVPEMPTGMTDVVHFEEKDDENLFRTGGSGSMNGANFHGIGGGKPDEKTHIGVYLEEVDDTIWKQVLHNETVPLVLAGVEYLIPIYKQVTDYNHVWDEALTGNHEHQDNQALYEHARTLMQPYFDQRVNKMLELYGNQSATSLTSTDAREIIPAAHYARISHLFVQNGASLWGYFNEAVDQITIRSEEGPDEKNLIDKAVVKAVLTGAEVYFLEKEEMPGGAPMAAIFRY